MYCPRCRTEYGEGVALCTECRIPLVSALPPEKVPEYVEFEEILSTFNVGDIAIIKAILDDTEIKYLFLGEQFSYMEPFVQPARLMVRTDQAQEARALLQDLTLSYSGVGHADEEAEGEVESEGEGEGEEQS